MRRTLIVRIPAIVLCCFLMACTSSAVRQVDRNIALEKQADAYYRSEDYLRSAALYQQLISILPARADYWYRLGNCNARLNQPEQAIDAYRETLVRDPSMSKAWYNLAMMQAKAVAQTIVSMSQNVGADDPAYRNLQRKLNTFLTAFDMEAIEIQQDAPSSCPREPVQGWVECICEPSSE